MKKFEGGRVSSEGRIVVKGEAIHRVKDAPFIDNTAIDRLNKAEEKGKKIREILIDLVSDPSNFGKSKDELLELAMRNKEISEFGEKKLRLLIDFLLEE